MKICKYCSVELIVNFNWLECLFERGTHICTKCSRAKNRLWHLNNKEHVNERKRNDYKNKKTIYLERRKNYYKLNKIRQLMLRKIRYEKNRDKELIACKQYRNTNRIKINEYRKCRRERDINYKLANNLRYRLNKAIKGNYKSGSAVKDLGCSIEEFKQYIESLFQPGMFWDNWSRDGWHIDHIVPLSSFDLTDREQFLKACHYTNLQPLWANENQRKGSKFINIRTSAK